MLVGPILVSSQDPAIIVTAGLIASALFTFVRVFLEESRDPTSRPKREERIEALIHSLNDANDVIREIEVEIRTRRDRAEKYQAQVEEAERILALSEGELRTARDLVGSEFRRESKKSFWLGLLVNFVFFVAGAGLTVLVK
jgi:hypothetical protein